MTLIYTIGHSTHPIAEFIEILQHFDVERIIDVRTIPKSRHNPQFTGDNLHLSLPEAGISYQRIAALGGLRHTPVSELSINGAWRNRSFRNYADYMQTPGFLAGLQTLMQEAKTSQVAIMCAEVLPWRCHRSLIGDALLIRGVTVKDIMSRTSAKPHTLTSFAKVAGERLWYPPSSDAEISPGTADKTKP